MPDALPELTLPRGLPCWLAAGHGVELMPIYADTQMRTGHARKRRVYRSAPRTVTVGMTLNQAQATAFFDWFEGALQAGVVPFATRVPNQGPGLLWWRARFVEPPTYETLGKLHLDGGWTNGFRITAKLLLTGSGSDTGPVDTTLASVSTVALHGSAAVTVGKPLASVSRVELVPATRLRSTSTVALVPAPPLVFLSASTADSATIGDTSGALVSRAASVAETAAVADVASGGLFRTAAVTESAATSSATDATIGAAGYTKSLLHFDGANGSTVFPDEVASNGITAHGGIALSTARSKYGGSSLLLDGVDDWLAVNVGGENLDIFVAGINSTVELWYYYEGSQAGDRIIVSDGTSGDADFKWQLKVKQSGGDRRLAFRNRGSSGAEGELEVGAFNMAPGTWYFISATKIGEVVYVHTDGFYRGQASLDGIGQITSGSLGVLSIGADGSGANFVSGNVEELRISKGAARSATGNTNYTVQASPFVVD